MDRYRLERQLGQGAMGTVHLVRRRGDNEQLALKRVAIVSEKDRVQALNEIAILRALSHPHVVRFDDSFLDGQELCIVMEYCAGGDLSDLLRVQRDQQKRLPELEVRGMVAQLASALAHMHSRRVVHRDIKASNVFVRGGGGGAAAGGGGGAAAGGGGSSAQRHLMLGDFGVAKALESTRAMACTQCGTPYYLPPEVCNGAPYNTKADIWSLGVLSYEMCALRLPFQAESLPALIMRILGGKFAPLASSLSPEIRGLVHSLLQQQPRDRPSVRQKGFQSRVGISAA